MNETHSPLDTLPPRQRRFVEEYLIDLNGKQAAIRAGYKERSAEVHASRLLRNAKVKSAVEYLKAIRVEKTGVDAEWVLTRLRTVAERCMQSRPVLDRRGEPVSVEGPDGKDVAAWTFDASGANRALELLGKHVGLFVERVKVEGSVRLEIVEEVVDAHDPQND